ncbi:MAG: hypothetical protein ACI8PT_000588 [Gammaproteobacteria bacterium]|jgi:hypothetical protein
MDGFRTSGMLRVPARHFGPGRPVMARLLDAGSACECTLMRAPE